MEIYGNSVYVLYRKRNNSYWEEGGIDRKDRGLVEMELLVEMKLLAQNETIS